MATTVLAPSQVMALEADDSHQASSLQLSSQNSRRDSRPLSLLSHDQRSGNDTFETQNVELSRARAVILIATLTGITFVGSMSGGLLTVCLPWIAADLDLPDNLLLW